MAGKTMQYAGVRSVGAAYHETRHRMIELGAQMDSYAPEPGGKPRNIETNRGRHVTVQMSPELAVKHGLALLVYGMTEIEFEKVSSALGSIDGFNVRADYRNVLRRELTMAMETAKAVGHLELAERIKRIEERAAGISVIRDSTARGFDPTAYGTMDIDQLQQDGAQERAPIVKGP